MAVFHLDRDQGELNKSDTTMTSAVDKLSFDVLGEIFSHYGEQETIFYPLETLLLVSRLWNQAVVGHHALWGRLRIYIGHEPTIHIWSTRLPLRLKRSGSFVPLEIDLRNSFEAGRGRDVFDHDVYDRRKCEKEPPKVTWACICMDEAKECAKFLLRILAGPNGENCKRWSTLNLAIAPGYYVIPFRTSSFDELCYPTPRLSSLSLEHLQLLGVEAFPSMPNLTTFSLHGCQMRALPDLSAAREVNLNFDWYAITDLPDLATLKHATLVEKLSLSMRKGDNDYYDVYEDQAWRFELPSELPNHQSLALVGGKLPTNLSEVRAPLLTRLSVQFDYSSLLAYIVNDCKLPLSKLQKLTFWLVTFEEDRFEPFYGYTKDLIQKADDLSIIEGDRRTLSLILKIFWEADSQKERWAGSYAGRTTELYYDNWGLQEDNSELPVKSGPHRIVLAGPPCRVDIEALASSLELLPPSLDLYEFQVELLNL